jgi:hypothetical protein
VTRDRFEEWRARRDDGSHMLTGFLPEKNPHGSSHHPGKLSKVALSDESLC